MTEEMKQKKPETESAAQMPMRENMNETAFFYPDLLAEDDGSMAIKFTLP